MKRLASQRGKLKADLSLLRPFNTQKFGCVTFPLGECVTYASHEHRTYWRSLGRCRQTNWLSPEQGTHDKNHGQQWGYAVSYSSNSNSSTNAESQPPCAKLTTSSIGTDK